jgi:hypothetical protein
MLNTRRETSGKAMMQHGNIELVRNIRVIALTDFQELLLSMLSSNYRLAVAFN